MKNKRRMLSVMIAIAMMLSLMPAMAFAEDATEAKAQGTRNIVSAVYKMSHAEDRYSLTAVNGDEFTYFHSLDGDTITLTDSEGKTIVYTYFEDDDSGEFNGFYEKYPTTADEMLHGKTLSVLHFFNSKPDGSGEWVTRNLTTGIWLPVGKWYLFLKIHESPSDIHVADDLKIFVHEIEVVDAKPVPDTPEKANQDAGNAQIAAADAAEWNGTIGAIPAAKSVKAKAAKKAVKVSWKKATKKSAKKFDKVEIQVCMDKNFQRSNTKRIEVKKSKKSAKVKGLSKKTTYYVRVRDVKGSGASKIVSKWSKVKKVKTK